MTKNDFLDRLSMQIDIAGYAWAADPVKRGKYMSLAAETINTSNNWCAIDGAGWINAWRLGGGKGKPTYKALRALPDGDA